MDYIKVTNNNIEKEHICCAISNNNDIQVSSKKAWLKERFGFSQEYRARQMFYRIYPRRKCLEPYRCGRVYVY